MKNNRKKQLREIYAAPPPVSKRKFFRKLPPAPMSTGYILWLQFSHISISSWLVSLAMLLMVLYLRNYYSEEGVAMVLASMPFLATVSIVESFRSRLHGMEELEMSCRFSLKSILLARMCIMGVENILLGLVIAFLLPGNMFQTVLRIFVFYLAAAHVCFRVAREMAGREGMLSCFGLAGVGCIFILFAMGQFPALYMGRYDYIWLMTGIILLYLTYREGKRNVQSVERYASF